MGSTEKRGYWFPAGADEVANFPGQTELLFMRKLDTDMDTALTAAIALARIPNLPASKTTSGTFAAARLPAATTSAQGAMSAADKTKLNGIAEGVGYVTEIPSAIDLNDYKTTGLYHQSSSAEASNGSNYPVNYAGLLEVATLGNFTYQTYYTYGQFLKVYVRTFYSATWYPWQEIGTGGGAAPIQVTELNGENLNDVQTSGLYTEDSTDQPTTALNYPVAGAPGQLTVTTSSRRSFQMYQTYDGNVYVRARYTTTWRDWTLVNSSGGGTAPAWVDGTIPDTAKMNANTKAKIRANGDGTATVVVSGGLGTAFSPANESEEVFSGAVEFPYSAAYAPAFDARSFVPVTGFDELFNSVTVQLVAGVQKTGTTSVRINLTRPPTQGSMQGQLVGFSITYLV